ncbi:WecB/TagA/CpsF family glycosyltransferase [uncultured Draconibacterium sp.]|uniref:WecB/TagA/CpsF family glycosyltransferase n=1 Tax=uncultured Draconibacterium sp. TaxID=1573823 RepID=UPI002AA61C34|nr:WecB/TagA/CpsF family glycosyltransferase [uncultured Draconibacterium sp.]
MNLQLSHLPLYNNDLKSLPNKKLLINTINAHCYNIAQNDRVYVNALQKSDVLLPDGISIVLAKRILDSRSINKIAGSDLFFYEMERLNKSGGKCFFLGSSNETLAKIKVRASIMYPMVKIKYYSPPFVAKFTKHDNNIMLKVINCFKPDVLFIGMTAPKQEKWAYENFDNLNVGHICTIGAVFDFFAGTVSRAPNWIIKIGFEWLYRLYKEPRRLWRRYLIGNFVFIYLILKEKTQSLLCKLYAEKLPNEAQRIKK